MTNRDLITAAREYTAEVAQHLLNFEGQVGERFKRQQLREALTRVNRVLSRFGDAAGTRATELDRAMTRCSQVVGEGVLGAWRRQCCKCARTRTDYRLGP